MSDIISNVSRLKPEIRLAQAVSHFEADLSSEQKNVFRSYRSQSLHSPPDLSDVMRLTAEIDRRASGKVGGRCFGPRFTNFLQVAQQFAALGDVIVGGSQNIIACGVWSLLRMSLLSVVNFSSYLEKMSALFMSVGRSVSRHQTMALLYPRSKDLQSHLSEYFIVVVRFCRQILKYTKQSVIRQIASTLDDSDVKLFQSELNYWANSIKEEINLLMATKIEEEAQQNSQTRSLSSKLFKSVSHQQKMATQLRVLDFCSTFDHETAWKQTRKVGNTTCFRQVVEYQEWKAGDSSSTLVYTGKLGSGKSVLLANIVDDLNIHVQNKKTPVAYFFCKHDTSESLKARTIIGSLARQLLRTTPDLAVAAKLCDGTCSALDVENIVNMLRRALPSDYKAYFVLDGLDECDHSEREIVILQLQELQKVLALILCISYRVEPSNALELSSERFTAASFASIPDTNPDIEVYIDAELENCLKGRKLRIGEPTLILEIRDALLKGSQGMFLWVALQIQSLCTLKTDQAICEALADLPKNLSETFCRILSKSGEYGTSYQSRILQLITVACRPLTVDELREALSVIPGDAVWNPSRLLNDIHSALACCGCLLTVDEEESTIRFVHHSVKQFLLRDSDMSTNIAFSVDSARRTMADIIVTYLNYGVFGTEVSTMRVPPIAIGSASSRIIHSTLDSSSRAQSLALKLLKFKKRPDLDISKVLAEARRPFQSRGEDEFEFFSYAQLYWLQNIFYISGEERVIFDLLVRLIESGVLNANALNEVDWTPLKPTARQWHVSIVSALLLSIQADANSKITTRQMLLTRMSQKGIEPIVKVLLEMIDIDVNSKDEHEMTPLSWAARDGHEEVVKVLLKTEKINVNPTDRYQMTPLSWAAKKEHKPVIIMLLERDEVDVGSKDYQQINSLSWTQTEQEKITKSLFETGKIDVNSRDNNNRTPLYRAIESRNPAIVRLLLAIDKIDVNLKIVDVRMPLSLAIDNGDLAIFKLLLETGKINVNLRDDLQTPLLRAVRTGNEAMVKLLLETDKIDVNSTENLQTPLSLAIDNGDLAIVKLLLQTGKIDVCLMDGLRTPLLRAVQTGNEAIVKLLLETGEIDVNWGVGPEIPLLQAVKTGNETMVKLLLEIDEIDVNVRDRSKMTALSWAVLEGHEAIVKILLDADKVDINSKEAKGRTPLFLAVEKGYQKIVEMLVKNDKIDVNSADMFYRTPLARAVWNGHEEIVRMLVKINAVQIDLRDSYGKTPLAYAMEKGDIITSLLHRAAVRRRSCHL